MSAGTRQALITINAPGAQGDPQAVSVTLSIAPPAFILSLPPSDLQIKVAMDKDSYHIGDKVTITLEVNRDSYIYVLDIDPAGTVTLIFPSGWSSQNFVRAGRFTLPDKSTYIIKAAPPIGKEYIQAVATSDPLDLRLLGVQRLPVGEGFATLGDNPLRVKQSLETAIQRVRKAAAAYTSFQILPQLTQQ